MGHGHSRTAAADLPTLASVGQASLLPSMHMYAEWVNAAYCTAQDPGYSRPISCLAGRCPTIELHNTSIIQWLTGGWTQTRGIIALDHTDQVIVVAFRGTTKSDWRNWVTNADFSRTRCHLMHKGEVHAGYHAAWTKMHADVYSVVTLATHDYPTYRVVVTGHSLGGALATLAGTYLRAVKKVPCDIYTYGSPRVGNREFVDFVDNQPGLHVRVTHRNDPVPNYPSTGIGYHHTTPEYWLFGQEPARILWTADQIKVCEGPTSGDCIQGEKHHNWKSHNYYFERMGCKSW